MKPGLARIDRPTWWAIGLSAVVLLALGLFLAWFNWDMLRGPLAAEISARTGRPVRIDGHLEVHPWSWSPSASVTQFKVGNPAWMHGGDVADFDRLTVAVRLWPLIALHQVDLPLVRAEAPKIAMYRSADGRTNWQFGPATAPTRLPPIQHFIIDNGHLTYIDKKRGLIVTGVMQSSETGGEAGAFHLTGDGTINGAPFLVAIAGAGLINVRHDRPYPFNANIRAGATSVAARGELPKPFDFGLMRANLVVSGNNFADLYDLTGLALPTTPPYRLSGELIRDGTTYTFHKVVGRVGSSDLEGTFKVDRKGDRPDMHADLRSRQMNIADLGALLGAPPRGPDRTPAQRAEAARLTSQDRLLPDATLAVNRVRSMDAVVRYRALSVQAGPNMPLRSFSLDLVMDHGVITADPVSFSLPHGDLAGRIRIDARGATPVTDLDMRVSNVRFEDFFRTSAAPPLQGLVEARARLHGVGASVHQAASNADGAVSIVAPHAQIRQALAELLGVDVIKGLGLYLAKDHSQTGVRCAVADFQAQGGMLEARTLVLDTDPVIATGKGSIDLRNETLNLTLQGRPKKFQLIRIAAPITLSGHLKSPKLGLKAGSAPVQAGAAIALGAFLSPLAAVLPFIDAGLGKNADCQALIAQAQARGAPVKTALASR